MSKWVSELWSRTEKHNLVTPSPGLSRPPPPHLCLGCLYDFIFYWDGAEGEYVSPLTLHLVPPGTVHLSLPWDVIQSLCAHASL